MVAVAEAAGQGADQLPRLQEQPGAAAARVGEAARPGDAKIVDGVGVGVIGAVVDVGAVEVLGHAAARDRLAGAALVVDGDDGGAERRQGR
jgi:hypothetical protein